MAVKTHGGYSVDVAEDGAIVVKPGDWLSKYCMAIYHDFNNMGSRFGRKNGSGLVSPIGESNVDSIAANEIIFDIATHNQWKQTNGNGSAPPIPNLSLKQNLALGLIDDFASRTGAAAFNQISRADVADGLRERVINAQTINQGRAGLCPSASVIFVEARDRPIAYVNLVIDLYEKGKGSLRTWTITPCRDLKNYLPPATDIHVADWIPMASIRDSENFFFEYQEVDYGYFFWSGGATSMGIAHWLRKAGYTDVINTDSLLIASTRKNLEEAERLRGLGYKIILRINADILSLPRNQWDNDSWNWRPGGNHFVVLTSPINFTNNPAGEMVDFMIYTWGSQRSIKPTGALQLKTSVYLGYHYGFVAAKF